MVNPLGIFDADLLATTEFNPQQVKEGWFDEMLISYTPPGASTGAFFALF